MSFRFAQYILPLLAVNLAACGNAKEPMEREEPFVSEARSRFGEQFTCEPNATEEYVLCAHQQDTTALSPLPEVAFFVFDTAESRISVEQSQITGSVKWVEEYEIEMILTPGIVTSEGHGAPKYRIDVRTGDRRRLDGPDGIPK